MGKKIALLGIYVITLFASVITSAQSNPVVVMETNKGSIKIEVWEDKAPISAANFLRYVDESYYDGLIFHRVIPGFMAQGGGFSEDMVQKSTFESIKNEASAALPNKRGTLAMARTNVVDSATSQFFINLVDNDFLNHTDNTPRGLVMLSSPRLLRAWRLWTLWRRLKPRISAATKTCQ